MRHQPTELHPPQAETCAPSHGRPFAPRPMALGPLQLMRTLRDSPAALRRKFSRDRTESLSHGDPLFKVHYLGTEKIYSLEPEQAEAAIGRLLEGAPPRKLGKDHALVVRPRYVEVKEIATGRQLTKTYLQDIAYCAADSAHPNVFLYICKQRAQQLQCRVFWCSRAERAREMTACLARSFQRALCDLQQPPAPPTTAPGEELEGEGCPGCPPPEPRSSVTLPANFGKVRWKKRTTHSPLKTMSRRLTAGDRRSWV
ncbi:low density lipoprotein receptor adapter protein 1 [Amia ocellicauda]|uniref:low density lipoprotein receptor adapter protein 1 n=1 Tax=Amia ocellicauda TaxID=2972642 RepID=UPI0034644041